jgi:hypothetical protein
MSGTLQDLELARGERLWDAVALWDHKRSQGAVYLFGYHAEMSLKLAYFRSRGLAASTALNRALLNTAAARAVVLHVATAHENFHSPRFWRDLLVAERAAANRPLDPTLATDLHAHVEAVYTRWRVEMRYDPPSTSGTDVELAQSAVDWIDRNLSRLHT